MFCKNCGKENKEDSKFCHNCGDTISTSVNMPSETDIENKIIKCTNCNYIGHGEKARSDSAIFLAWVCIFFTPLITLLYFSLTHKWRCPKCKSTLLSIKNQDGFFVSPSKNLRILSIILLVFVIIAIIGIISSVFLASLNN
jgi:uncharacterized membrane protein YvbJ